MKNILIISFFIFFYNTSFANTCTPPRGEKVVLNKGANNYETSIITHVLENELIDGFKSYIDSHVKYGCNSKDCRYSLTYELSFDSNSIDLNNDAEKEVFFEYDSPGYCGSSGCEIHILSKSLNKEILSGKSFFLTKKYTNGYRDIYSIQRSYEENNDCEFPFVILSCKFNSKLEKYSCS